MKIGRYLNHGAGPAANCRPLHPLVVRGKWRVGFISIRHIPAGEEIVWDYQVREEEWMRARGKGVGKGKALDPTQPQTSSCKLLLHICPDLVSTAVTHSVSL